MNKKVVYAFTSLILMGCNVVPAGEIPSVTPAQPILPTISTTAAVPTEPPIPGITPSLEITLPSPVPTEEFNSENLNSVLPEGIMEEVAYFPIGSSGSGCYDWRFQSPSIFPKLPPSIELVPLEEFRTIQVSLCGVVPGESIKLEIMHQGTNTVVLQEEMTAQSISGQERGYVDFSPYAIPFDAPTGDYIFSISGSEGALDEHRLKVEESHHTRLLLLDSTLYFYNFMPDEIIKLLVYTAPDNPRQWKFVGWNQVKMTRDGSLTLKTDVDVTSIIGYVALRDNFETIPSVRSDDDGLFGINTFSCNGAPHQIGIGPGKYARFVSEYESDGFNEAPFEVGTLVRIREGPYCKNDRIYWRVDCLEGNCFFRDIPEGGPEGFYLQPVGTDYLTQISPPTPTPVIDTVNTMDNAHVIFIPQGSFEMGLNPDQYMKLMELGGFKDLLDASQPVHMVTLDSYKIYKTEVSNRMYSLCVAAGVCTPPISYSSETHNSYFGNPDYADYPVVFVTWYMAQNYCQWAGGRLPTEAEWEYAARGSNANLFPWGEQIFNFEEYANVEWRYSDTTSVHSLPLGASPFGLLNMAGNVWEWVFDWYRADYYETTFNWDNPIGPESGDNLNGELKTGKGGSYWISFANSSPAIRDWYQANQAGSAVGFRCVIEK